MGFWESLGNLVKDMLSSVLTLAGDVLIFLFEMIVTAVLAVISTLLDAMTGDITTVVNAMNAVPAETWDLAYRVGLKEASTMIATALTIKFVLQLIPFIRVGSK